MRKLKILFCFFLLLTSAHISFGQTEPDPQQTQLDRVIPVSPTAGSITRYGNTPVNYFTGSPNISIPLYEVSVGGLKVPLSLNYQYDGLKVEEIASWVGLGWNLSAGGAITRTIRGIADDAPNGYMSPALPMTAKFMIDNMTNPAYSNDIKTLRKEAASGNYDIEPDIFYFSFPGGSGKFFYNQETQRFYTLPAQKSSIVYNGGGFIITREDGTRFYFLTQEYTSVPAPACSGSAAQAGSGTNTTAWYLSKIVNKTQTDSIVFEYAETNYSFDNISTSTKYIMTSESGSVSPTSGASMPAFPDQVCWQTTTINGKRLSYIRFRNGYIKLTPDTAARCDLPGDRALQKIEVFNKANQLVKSVKFEYGYFGGVSACSLDVNTRRLKLEKIWEEGRNGAAITPYRFAYEEEGTFPSRLSYAQDFWGYYNGKTANTSLIPPVFHNGSYLSGDDRLPGFQYARLGALKKLTYPTGGATEYIYENHEVNDTLIQPGFVLVRKELEGDHNGGIQSFYVDTFYVDEEPNFYNYYDTERGAYVDVDYTAVGCDLSGGANTCAILTIEGQTTGTISLGPLHDLDVIRGHYLPKGKYVLKASFNQNPAMYEDFYFTVQWRKAMVDTSYSRQVGGIRLLRTIDHDSISSANKIIRNFDYRKDETGFSSGKVCGYPSNYTTEFANEYYSSHNLFHCDVYSYFRTFLKRTSISNYPLVATQGGYVGYEQVRVSYGENNENGNTVYRFQHFTDILSDFPSVATSREWARGILLAEKTYRKEGGSDALIRYDSLAYTSLENIDSSLRVISYGLKPYFTTSCSLQPNAPCNQIYWYQRQDELSVPDMFEYETITSHSLPSEKRSTTYDEGRSILTIQYTSYNGRNYQPAEIKMVSSRQDTLITRYTYNTDYAPLSGNPQWLQQLINRGVIDFPVERLSVVKDNAGNEKVTKGIITITRNDSPVPFKVYSLETASPVPVSSFTKSAVNGSGSFIKDGRYAEAISFNAYDSTFKIREQRKTNDIAQVYIWDYDGIYPVAECLNADTASVAATSFESNGKGGWSFAGTAVNEATAPTGKKGYDLSAGNISRSGLNGSGTYIVSYWLKNGSGSASVNAASGTSVLSRNGWTLFRHMVSATGVTVSGTGTIDELRLYPSAAMVTTYTYEPLVGITSQCDPNNNITYYEYDELNRLSLVRDQDRNVLKRVCYNYAGQQEDCVAPVVYENTLQSSEFTRNDCPTGYAGTAVTFSVPAGTYTSMVSQADANNQAQAALLAGGQAYANANGDCVCDTYACTGPGQKCVNGICETGIKVYISSVYSSRSGGWICSYRYEWSDCSYSMAIEELEVHPSPCTITTTCP